MLQTDSGEVYKASLFNVSEGGVGLIVRGMIEAIPAAMLRLLLDDPQGGPTLAVQGSVCWTDQFVGHTFMGLQLDATNQSDWLGRYQGISAGPSLA